MTKRVKEADTQRNAGPVDIGSTRMTLGGNTYLEYVQDVHRLVFGRDSFLVVLYGALNVGGLIGTEHNGIAILWENRGKVALMDHCRDSSYQQASPKQRAEYQRICDMEPIRFKAFINDNPTTQCKVLLDKPRVIIRPRLGYGSAGFTATQFDTVTDKVMFIEALVKFLCNHCDRDRFTRRVYDGLSQHLGHIAHYNMSGFYDQWFEDLPDRIKFLEYHSGEQIFGGWRDVAEVLKHWIVGPEGQAVLDRYKHDLARRTERAERRQLAELKSKYESTDDEET